MPKPYIPNDTWSRRAAEEGYRARSVYKLQEIDDIVRLLKPGMKVLDIGAAPGSWLQYVSKRIGPQGLVLGLDLKPIVHVGANVKTAVCDIKDFAAVQQAMDNVGMKHVDMVLSDIAPNTSGIKDVDQWKSVELSMFVHDIAKKVLTPSGILVMKIFRGKSFDAFITDVKVFFLRIKVLTVAASRDRSREVYVVCWRKR